MSSLTVHTVTEIERMATAIAKSDLFGVKRPEQALALMLIAQAEGLHPATAAQEYDIVQGRPALKSMAALARFQRAGGSIEWITRTDAVAEARFSHPHGGSLAIRWDMARAQQAGLAKKAGPWTQYPAQMLAARVVAEGVRAVYPACLSGAYTVEEAQDFDAPVQRKAAPVDAPAEVMPEQAALEQAAAVPSAYDRFCTIKDAAQKKGEQSYGTFCKIVADFCTEKNAPVEDFEERDFVALIDRIKSYKGEK